MYVCTPVRLYARILVRRCMQMYNVHSHIQVVQLRQGSQEARQESQELRGRLGRKEQELAKKGQELAKKEEQLGRREELLARVTQDRDQLRAELEVK